MLYFILTPRILNVMDDTLTYLLQDEFYVHLMGPVNNQINKMTTTEADITPGRYTGSVQLVLDKGVNKPFKGYLRDEFEECTHGLQCQPLMAEVTQWVAHAWAQATAATIVNTCRQQ
jgi:hypothetical protein